MKRITHYNEKEQYYDVKKAYLSDINEYDGEAWINTYNAYQKLGELEDIEEELGIDLITLFKAMEQQKVWTKYENEIDCCDYCEYIILEDFIYFYWEKGKHLVFELNEYGKTWALTKEELDNDK